MFKASDININTETTVGRNFLLVATRPSHAYEGGTRTNRVNGTVLTVLCLDRAGKRLPVTVPLTNYQFDGIQFVDLIDLSLHIYIRGDQIQLAGRAKSVKLKTEMK